MQSEVNLLGRVADISWFELKDGRVVSVHVAEHEDGDTMFYSDNKTFPSITANNMGIKFSFMRNATDREAKLFFAAHSDLEVVRSIPIWKLGA